MHLQLLDDAATGTAHQAERVFSLKDLWTELIMFRAHDEIWSAKNVTTQQITCYQISAFYDLMKDAISLRWDKRYVSTSQKLQSAEFHVGVALVLPCPSWALVRASLAVPKPSSLHTTLAAFMSHRWSHMVPHFPSLSTSTRPSPSRGPAFRRTTDCKIGQKKQEVLRWETKTLWNYSFGAQCWDQSTQYVCLVQRLVDKCSPWKREVEKKWHGIVF